MEGVHLTNETLFIFVDESGNFDFSESGTKHLVMSAVMCFQPRSVATKILDLKYSLYEEGLGVSSFHATDDRQNVRNRVFARISEIEGLNAHTMWLNKRHLSATNLGPNLIFSAFGKFLVSLVSSQTYLNHFDKCVVVFDKTLLHREEMAFRSSAKQYFSSLKVPIHIYFHNVNREPISQVADYIAWAQYVGLERNETRPLESLPQNLKSTTQLQASLENLLK